MADATGRFPASRGTALAISAALLLGALPARGQGAPKLAFYPSLNLRFEAGEAKNFFHSWSWVVNTSGALMTDLVLTQRFPEGFSGTRLDMEALASLKRPEGHTDSLEGDVYTLRLPELRIAEATALTVELSYKGRPGPVTFPGVEVEYTQGGERHSEKGPDRSWELSKYTKYSGTIRDFIKRYAGLDLRFPRSTDAWGFNSIATRAEGRFPMGVVEIEEAMGGRLGFSIEAGTPGSFRQLMLSRRRFDPARDLLSNDEVRRYIMNSVKSSADFVLDEDGMSITKRKIGRWEAWVADTRWRDRVKDRLGEGPSRWYIFVDQDSENQYVLNISAQGRGVGAGNMDAPNPEREQELISELEGIVESMRIL